LIEPEKLVESFFQTEHKLSDFPNDLLGEVKGNATIYNSSIKD